MIFGWVGEYKWTPAEVVLVFIYVTNPYSHTLAHTHGHPLIALRERRVVSLLQLALLLNAFERLRTRVFSLVLLHIATTVPAEAAAATNVCYVVAD